MKVKYNIQAIYRIHSKDSTKDIDFYKLLQTSGVFFKQNLQSKSDERWSKSEKPYSLHEITTFLI